MAHCPVPPGSTYFYYPRLVCVVGVRDESRGTVNLAPAAWTTPLSSDPPLFGVCLSPRTHTHHLLLQTGEFTVNFLPHRDAAVAHSLGKLSGKQVDKVQALGLELQPGEVLGTPWLAAAYAAAECALVDRHQMGDQTLCVGEVHGIHVDDAAFDADGVLRVERVLPLLYLGNNQYVTTDAATAVRPGPGRLPEGS